jgi:hypothetical protein
VIQFPDCFFLIFGQMALGGFLCLAVPPFHEIERGFYKSSAAVFLGAALATVGGKAGLLLIGARPPGRWPLAEVAAWAIFAIVASVYLYSLWGEPYRLRARAYLATLATGMLALVVSASRFRLAPLPSVETLLYPLSFLVSSAALGTAVTGMLLGHWYLIDTGMSLVPLRRVLHAFLAALGVQILCMALIPLALAAGAAPETQEGLAILWQRHTPLLLTRVALGPIAGVGLGIMIARTLAIPETMAATGLFYIAVLAVAVGEMLGRLLLFRTALPL